MSLSPKELPNAITENIAPSFKITLKVDLIEAGTQENKI